MRAIFKKEINTFFADYIGFIVLGLYWIINVLFLWVIDSGYNILNAGNANLIPFFEFSAFAFIFLIPAIGMKSFTEERKLGTLQLLYTKPISKLSLVLGKFLAIIAIVCLALIPSILYTVYLGVLVQETQTLDYSAIAGSYLGLLLLIFAFAAISLWASSLTKNLILSFSLGVVFSLICFFAFAEISYTINSGTLANTLEYLSLSKHFRSLSRGVIDSRNVVFFLSFTSLIISICVYQLQKSQEE